MAGISSISSWISWISVTKGDPEFSLAVSVLRLRRLCEAATIEDDAEVTKPCDWSWASMSRAISAVVSPAGDPSRAKERGTTRLSTLGRVRRVRRPTVSPLRSFWRSASRTSESSFAGSESRAFWRFILFSSCACLRFSSASFSSAAVWFSTWHFWYEINHMVQYVSICGPCEPYMM